MRLNSLTNSEWFFLRNLFRNKFMNILTILIRNLIKMVIGSILARFFGNIITLVIGYIFTLIIGDLVTFLVGFLDGSVIWIENIVYSFNWEKTLLWTNKKFVYWIFINKLFWYYPKITYKNIVQKDMNKFTFLQI
mgnify:CR=1 FL=1